MKCIMSHWLLFLTFFITTYLRNGYHNILHSDGKKISPTEVKQYESFVEAVSRGTGIFYHENLKFCFRDSFYILKRFN